MDNAEKRKNGADRSAEGRKPCFMVNQKGQHTTPEKPRNDESIAEHRQRLKHGLQTQRQFVRRDIHCAHELAKNYKHQTGNNRQDA